MRTETQTNGCLRHFQEPVFNWNCIRQMATTLSVKKKEKQSSVKGAGCIASGCNHKFILFCIIHHSGSSELINWISVSFQQLSVWTILIVSGHAWINTCSSKHTILFTFWENGYWCSVDSDHKSSIVLLCKVLPPPITPHVSNPSFVLPHLPSPLLLIHFYLRSESRLALRCLMLFLVIG